MVSKYRYVIGILVLTIIFVVLSAISLSNLFDNIPKKEEDELVKNDYFLALEEELGLSFVTNDEYENLSLVTYDVLIEPSKLKNHYKPCFNFVIESDGVVIKNALSKEYYDYNFQNGMKITHINDVELQGKGYFEVLELLYATSNEEKTYKLSTGNEIKYVYGALTDRLYYDESEDRLYVYNLDKITQKAIHQYYLDNPNMILDLSMASVNTYEGVYEFVSLFINSEEVLFEIPKDVYAKDNVRKITSLTIDLGDNTNSGILFAATTINRFNTNITFSKEVNTTEFYSLKTISITNYNIYLKNNKLELKDLTIPGEEEF